MTDYLISNLKQEIQVILDRNRNSTSLIDDGDIDTLMQDDVIGGTIVRAAQIIEQNAPGYMIDADQNLNTYLNPLTPGPGIGGTLQPGISQLPGATPIILPKITWEERSAGSYIGRLPLPKMLMRLMSVKMSDWSRPGRIITEDDAEYLWQSSDFAGVRGNPHKPIAAIVSTDEGMTLELYSCKSISAKVERGAYINYPEISGGSISLAEKLKQAIVYEAARLVCLTMGDVQTAAGLEQTAMRLAGMRQQMQQAAAPQVEQQEE